ncbi:MAG: carbohydrate kinase family protein [Thermoflexales bacterium]|nr:carbohydrate kinase family protein [Thermoflexales bacterium]
MTETFDKTFDVVVVGNVGIDTNVYGQTIDLSVESNFTEDLDYVGQAGGYASRGFAQLGKRTAFIGYVGDDPLGRWIRDEFARDGVDTTALFVDPAGTSRSVNLMYPDGRRKNFYDGKSHMTLQPDLALCRSVLSQARLAHFNIPNWARRLLPIARECGLTISCDIQDVVRLDDPYRRDFIQHADILFFSATNMDDPTAMIEACLELKPGQIVVVGMGARGCALGSAAGVRFFEPVDMAGAVIDTNGAGDGLAVGFLSSYVLEGYSPQDSVRRGQVAARYTCTQKASSSQLIRPAQLERFFKS